MMKNDYTNKKKEENVTSGLIEFFGICSTCNDAPTCKNSRNSTHPVWHCEQFDNYTPQVIDAFDNNMISKGGLQISSKPEAANLEKYKGLCINCDHRETCIHSHTEGGVWHCAEYQ